MTSSGDIVNKNGYAIIRETNSVIPGTKPDMIPNIHPIVNANSTI